MPGSVPEERSAGPDGAPPARGRPVPILLNPRAGHGDADAHRRVLDEALRRAGVDPRIESLPPDRIPARARELAGAGEPRVGVAGGDGTLLFAAEALAESGTALAPFAVGTLNHFARRIGLGDLAIAAAALAGGPVGFVPVGRVGDRLFLNTVTFGFYADVVRRRGRLRRWVGKWPAAGVASLATLSRLAPVEVEVETPGGAVHRRTPLVWVGAAWGSRPVIEAPEDPADPVLEVALLRATSRVRVLGFGLRLVGRMLRERPPGDDPALEVLRTRRFVLRYPRALGVTLDGEPGRLASPVEVGLRLDALRTVFPPGR